MSERTLMLWKQRFLARFVFGRVRERNCRVNARSMCAALRATNRNAAQFFGISHNL